MSDSPRCTLWEHQSLVSALIGTQTGTTIRPALVQFNIADVQPFVTAARRTQDLWAGSYLISFLAWTMLQYIAERFGRQRTGGLREAGIGCTMGSGGFISGSTEEFRMGMGTAATDMRAGTGTERAFTTTTG